MTRTVTFPGCAGFFLFSDYHTAAQVEGCRLDFIAPGRSDVRPAVVETAGEKGRVVRANFTVAGAAVAHHDRKTG